MKYLVLVFSLTALPALAQTTVVKPVNQFGQIQHQQGGFVIQQQNNSAVIKPVNQFGQIQHQQPSYVAKPK